MANTFQDLSKVLVPLGPTFPPQLHAASANGVAVRVDKVGTNRIMAQLLVGDADTLTSLNMKIQAARDNGSGSADAASWVDITGAAFTAVTADAGATAVAPETIEFQLPKAVAGQAPYEWIRGVSVLVGTSIGLAVNLLACRRYDGNAANVAAPGNAGNNLVN